MSQNYSLQNSLESMRDSTKRQVERKIEELGHESSGNVQGDIRENLKTLVKLESPNIGKDEIQPITDETIKRLVEQDLEVPKALSKSMEDEKVSDAMAEINSIADKHPNFSIGIELEMPAVEGFMNASTVSDLKIPSDYGDMVLMEDGPTTAEIRTDRHSGLLSVVNSVHSVYEMVKETSRNEYEDTSIPMNNPMDTGMGIDMVQSQFPGLHIHINTDPRQMKEVAEGVMEYGRELAFLSTGFDTSDYDSEDYRLSLRQARTKGGGGMEGLITLREDLSTLEYRMFDVVTKRDEIIPLVGAVAGLHTYYGEKINGERPKEKESWINAEDGKSIGLSDRKWEEYRTILEENKFRAFRDLEYRSMRDKVEKGLESLGVEADYYLKKMDKLYSNRFQFWYDTDLEEQDIEIGEIQEEIPEEIRY